MLWFISASLVSLFIGLFMVNLLHPGKDLNMPLPATSASSGLSTTGFSLQAFIKHAVPDSAVGALANNEILQIVIISILFGLGGRLCGPPGTRPGVADRGSFPCGAEGHRLCHELGAPGGVRRHLRHRHRAGARHPRHHTANISARSISA